MGNQSSQKYVLEYLAKYQCTGYDFLAVRHTVDFRKFSAKTYDKYKLMLQNLQHEKTRVCADKHITSSLSIILNFTWRGYYKILRDTESEVITVAL